MCVHALTEPGLGKALQTITLMLTNVADAGSPAKGNLVVAPLSVISAWKVQFDKFVKPGVLNVEIYHAPIATPLSRSSVAARLMCS